jgi:hypothetical protein
MGIVIVAATIVVVAGVVSAAGVVTSALWVFEILAGVGAVVGLGLAFGVLDRRRTAGREVTTPPEALSDEVERILDAIDPVEHRRLDLGTPWPTVVVGPTGVAVIAVASGTVRPEVLERVRSVLSEVRGLLRAGADGRRVTVRGIVVVPDTRLVADDLGAGIRPAGADELLDLLARGPLVSMRDVVRTFARLSGALAPDLRVVS